MPYRCNINYVLSQDQTVSCKLTYSEKLVRLSLAAIYFNKQCDHILCRLIRCLENQLLNISCMDSGKYIHLEMTTGSQSTSVRHNKRRALGPTGAYRIEYRLGQPVHTRALASVTLGLLVL